MRCAPRLFPLLTILIVASCRETTAPPMNVVVTVEPRLEGVFASLGGTHIFYATVADTVGNPLTHAVTWDVVPTSPGITIADGIVTVSKSATPGDYRVRATASGITDSAIVRVLPKPSGKLIFSASLVGGAQIFVKDFAVDGDAVQITNSPGSVGGLAVDQTTGTIFFSKGALPSVDIFRMNADGTGLVNLTNDVTVSNQGPTIHPITREVYFTRRGLTGTVAQVFRMRQDGSGVTEVTTGTGGKLVPAISPDGRMLAWSESFPPGVNLEIVTATIDGGAAARFTERAGTDASPYWVSPSRLLWGNTAGGQFDILAADAPSGANLVNLTKGIGTNTQPSAACMANAVTIVRFRDAETHVYQLDLVTGLAVKYLLPVSRSVGFARRLC